MKISGTSSRSSNAIFPTFASLWPRGSTNTILSVASEVNAICGSLIAELLTPKSTSSERIISTMRSASASLSPMEIPGKDLWKSAIALGSSVEEIEGSAATMTRPVFLFELSRVRAATP